MDRRRITGAGSLLVAVAAIILASPPASGALTTVASHPRVGARLPAGSATTAGWASSNWSGYAITGGPYTSITGSWTVAPVAASNKQTFSSTWIGIDGFNNSNLIQTGTEADYYGGAAHYDAWWEILPASETVIPSMSVQPGDVMSADIHELPSGSWSITITDARPGRPTNQTFSTTQTYTGPLSSAEWIEEAPQVGGRIATLAHYSTFTADPGTVNGGNPGLTAADSGVMIQRNTRVSTPSSPDTDTDGFAMAYGSTPPGAPSS